VGELSADVAGAQDGDARAASSMRITVSEVCARPASKAPPAGDGRHDGAGTGRDHDLLGRDLLLADAQYLGPDEPAVSRNRSRSGLSARHVSPGVGDGVDAAEDAVAHLRPVGARVGRWTPTRAASAGLARKSAGSTNIFVGMQP
jgi:hypothetical protein